MKTIIGVVGEKGSGKETFVSLLQKHLGTTTVIHTRSSDILAETLTLWDIPHTRENLQHMAIIMDEGFALGTLTHAVQTRISTLDADIVVFDGVRWHTDAKMIRSFPSHFLVYVTADVETRYARTKSRKEKVGEAFASLETFMQEEKAKTELDIPEIGATADMRIDNTKSLEEFEAQVKLFCAEYLKK